MLHNLLPHKIICTHYNCSNDICLNWSNIERNNGANHYRNSVDLCLTTYLCVIFHVANNSLMLCISLLSLVIISTIIIGSVNILFPLKESAWSISLAFGLECCWRCLASNLFACTNKYWWAFYVRKMCYHYVKRKASPQVFVISAKLWTISIKILCAFRYDEILN